MKSNDPKREQSRRGRWSQWLSQAKWVVYFREWKPWPTGLLQWFRTQTWRDWGRACWTLAKWSMLLCLVGVSVVSIFLYLAYQEYIVRNPGPHIEYDHIQGIIFQESPIFYENGEALGVLQAKEHRVYVEYDDLPEAWVQAITASEDQRYFEHPGIDVWGIGRAMRQNLQAGKVVAGGSTLTQQTAKNLYYRPDRSWGSKWEELKDALRLEAHFSKEQILEFYANQFHVSSTGRGIGIAARYFFDKDVAELDLIECAYIAGMVKSPSTYNPFIGKSQESRDIARQRAHKRTRYVLDRMLVVGHIDARTHAALTEQDIPFQQGTFQFRSNILVDEITRRLDQSPFPQLFQDLGIDNPSTAGIRIRTSLHPVAQTEATYALWHHLSDLGPLIEGQSANDLVLTPESAPTVDPYDLPKNHEFRYATVTTSHPDRLELDLGGHACRVERDGLERMATILARAEKGVKNKIADASRVDALARVLQPGTVVWVSVREWDVDDRDGLCDLEIRPELQGSVVLVQNRQIKAMVGGNDNRDFNRARARRQLGSTWKPLVYMAAMEAGWSTVDRLDNRNHVFPFTTSWYYPRADHRGEPFVSMSWAGVRSENLASIWLLAHLPDRMDSETFQREAYRLGLAPKEGQEGSKSWELFVKNDLGVISSTGWIPELAFNAARFERIAGDTMDWEERIEVQSLMYGNFNGRYTKHRTSVERMGAGRTKRRKLWALDSSFLRFQQVGEACQEQVSALSESLAGSEEASHEEDVFRIAPFHMSEHILEIAKVRSVPDPADFGALYYQREGESGVRIACGSLSENWQLIDSEILDDLVYERATIPQDLTNMGDAKQLDFWVDGRIRWSTLQDLSAIADFKAVLFREMDAYDMDLLQYHPDFRIQFALHYLADVAAEMGVVNDIDKYLSMPLGAEDISLLEMVGVYEGFTGHASGAFHGYGWDAEGRRVQVENTVERQILILEIEDRNGTVLYRADGDRGMAKDARVESGRLTGDILRNVVKWGTGKRAHGAVKIGDAVVPVAGKTGTTNDFKNAAFLGFVPSLSASGWEWGEGYTLGVYVGYDDNRKMVRGNVKVAGSLGALPTWILTAQGLAEAGFLGTGDPVSPEYLIGSSSGLTRLDAQPKSGLPIALDRAEPSRTKYELRPSERGILVPVGDPFFLESDQPSVGIEETDQWDDEDEVPIWIVSDEGTVLPPMP